jgi:hypothetical protein
MPERGIMYRTPVLTIVFTLLIGTAAFAQLPPQPPPPASPLGQGTEQERAACHPDVMKFCQAVLASNGDDVFGILSCLQQNRAKISIACNQVLTSHGQ